LKWKINWKAILGFQKSKTKKSHLDKVLHIKK